MELIYHLLIVLHLIGMAIIVGGYLVTVRAPKLVPGIAHAALLQLVTGVAMVGLRESGAYDDPDGDLDQTKVAVKLAIALVVAGLAWVNRKRGDSVEPRVFHAIGGLALVNVLVAVLW